MCGARHGIGLFLSGRWIAATTMSFGCVDEANDCRDDTFCRPLETVALAGLEVVVLMVVIV